MLSVTLPFDFNNLGLNTRGLDRSAPYIVEVDVFIAAWFQDTYADLNQELSDIFPGIYGDIMRAEVFKDCFACWADWSEIEGVAAWIESQHIVELYWSAYHKHVT